MYLQECTCIYVCIDVIIRIVAADGFQCQDETHNIYIYTYHFLCLRFFFHFFLSAILLVSHIHIYMYTYMYLQECTCIYVCIDVIIRIVAADGFQCQDETPDSEKSQTYLFWYVCVSYTHIYIFLYTCIYKYAHIYMETLFWYIRV